MINIKKLKCIQNRCYYEGELFTGVGFRTSGEKIEDVCEIENGVNINVYTNKYFPTNKNIAHIDIDYIDFTGEYLDNYALYNNNKFSGIAYELEGEQETCLGQHLIENGVTIVSMRWYSSGENESLRLVQKSVIQYFEWFKDGFLKEISLYLREVRENLINIKISEKKKLKTVWINENYFEWVLKYKNQIEYHYFESSNSFKDCNVAPILSLIDSGVNDEVFYSIAANDGFKDLSKIIISNTSLTEAALLELTNIKTLKEVIFCDKQRNLLGIAQEIKRKRPDCLIELNNQKILTD